MQANPASVQADSATVDESSHVDAGGGTDEACTDAVEQSDLLPDAQRVPQKLVSSATGIVEVRIPENGIAVDESASVMPNRDVCQAENAGIADVSEEIVTGRREVHNDESQGVPHYETELQLPENGTDGPEIPHSGGDAAVLVPREFRCIGGHTGCVSPSKGSTEAHTQLSFRTRTPATVRLCAAGSPKRKRRPQVSDRS